MSYDLQEKVIFITGAASGIGKETAFRLSQLGAQLILSDINEGQGKEVASEINENGGRAEFHAADVSDAAVVKDLLARIDQGYARLDCAINNAGVEHPNLRLADCDDELWDRVIDVNLKGVFLCMREELKLMLKYGGGNIINLASVAGLAAAPMLGPYAASKFGVVGLTKSTAVEYARQNIRCNAVCPSFVDTPMVRRSMDKMDEHLVKRIVGANPMHRLGEPGEIADLISWLCSDESSFITGQAIAADGGLTA